MRLTDCTCIWLAVGLIEIFCRPYWIIFATLAVHCRLDLDRLEPWCHSRHFKGRAAIVGDHPLEWEANHSNDNNDGIRGDEGKLNAENNVCSLGLRVMYSTVRSLQI